MRRLLDAFSAVYCLDRISFLLFYVVVVVVFFSTGMWEERSRILLDTAPPHPEQQSTRCSPQKDSRAEGAFHEERRRSVPVSVRLSILASTGQSLDHHGALTPSSRKKARGDATAMRLLLLTERRRLRQTVGKKECLAG